MKKEVKIAIIAIAVLLVLLIAVSALTPKQKIESLDSDSLYAYSYEMEKSGLIITIKGDFPKGSRWECSAEGSSIEVAPKGKGSSKQQRFIIKPAGNGTDKAVFTLLGGEDGETFLYEIASEVYSANGESIVLLGNYHREAAEAYGEEIGEAAVSIQAQADGSLKVYIRGGNAVNWETDYELDCVDVFWESENYEEAEKVLTINYRSLGQGPVVIFDPNAEMGVRMMVMTDLLGNVQLDRYEVMDYVRRIPEEAEEE